MRIVLRLLPFLRRQWWRDRFVDNPLLRREIKFHLRRPLMSPGFWLIVVLLYGFGMHVLFAAREMGMVIELLSQETGGSPFVIGRRPVHHLWVDEEPWQSLLAAHQWGRAVLPLLLGWAIGRIWRRERDPAVRQSLAVTPINTRQVMGARVLPWLFLALGLPLLGQAIAVTMHGACALMWLAEFPRTVMSGTTPWLFREILQAVALALSSLALVGLGTRCALWGWPPIAGGLACWVFDVMKDELPALMWMFPIFLRSTWPPWYIWLLYALALLPSLVIALLTWRGLAARIARDYPLAP